LTVQYVLLASLTPDDAAAFIQYQQKLLEDMSMSADDVYDPAKIEDGLDTLPSYENEPLLVAIEHKLEEMIKVFGNKGAFVKMSDRSPKDSTTERGRIHRALNLDFVASLPAQEKRNYLASNATGLPAIYKGMMKSMKVTSGKEALRLLLMSFRTLEDVQMRLDFKDQLWELDIVVREVRVCFLLHNQ